MLILFHLNILSFTLPHSKLLFDPDIAFPLLLSFPQLVQRMPMGAIIKTITYYKTAFWRDLGMYSIQNCKKRSMLSSQYSYIYIYSICGRVSP